MTMNSNLGLLSYSSCCLLHTCPRKFQLYKLLNPEIARKERDHHTDFGHLVGYGIQQFLITRDKNTVYLSMLSVWQEDLDDEAGVRDKKTFWHALAAIDKFEDIMDSILRDFEVVIFDSKPAAELGFCITFFDSFKYRGFLDLLLINKITGQFVVIECKTTKFKNVSEAQYAKSAQGLGYSIVVDAISSALKRPQAASFQVLYLVWLAGAYEWQEFPIEHSHTDRAIWLKNALLDIKHIAEYAQEEHFPQYGESCYDFFRACEYLEICGMSDKALLLDKSKEIKDDEKYQFHFTLEEMIEAQSEKHGLVL